jgi:hypothetical protein
MRARTHYYEGAHQLFWVLSKTGLLIRIHFLRIRIQSLMLETNTDPDPNPDPDPDPNPIRIQGLNDQKLKKNYN